MITGNPVRAAIAAANLSREEGVRFFKLDPARKTVLSVGGSLGAKSINEAIDKHIDAFAENGLQLIWQTGKLYAARAINRAAGKSNIRADDFITRMEYAYAAADLVISRSGAMAIAELCVQEKPVILVPYPFAAEDHQTVNAQNLVNKNAGIMIKDSEALDRLVPAIVTLAGDETRQKELKTNIARLAVKNADEVIAGEILKYLQTVKS